MKKRLHVERLKGIHVFFSEKQNGKNSQFYKV